MHYIVGIIPGILFGILFYFGDRYGVNEILRNLGFLAFVYLCLSLLITPIANLTYIQKIRPFRKVFGVFAFLLGIFHSAKYFYDEALYNNGKIFILEHFYEKDVFSGVIGIIIISLLGISSLNYIHRIMGKYWGQLHSLVFPLFCIIALHIAFASRFDVKYMLFIALVVGVRVIALEHERTKKTHSGGKYICVPCGFIYDPHVGDPDGGIAPGTKFEDIPDSWICPLCGVSKADFIPFDDTVSHFQKAEVIQSTFLNDSTLELIIKTEMYNSVIPGQFAKILLSDTLGDFSRSYSVVKSSGNMLTFCIKLGKGRSSSILKSLKKGDTLGIEGIFGKFILQNTKNKKVFIATGTGLAPIINMLENSQSLVEKSLYFGVATQSELFYENRLQNIPLLETHIFLSQEKLNGYKYGRINIGDIHFEKNTEFYICGNPSMVESTVSLLKTKGYHYIFTEKFI